MKEECTLDPLLIAVAALICHDFLVISGRLHASREGPSALSWSLSPSALPTRQSLATLTRPDTDHPDVSSTLSAAICISTAAAMSPLL